MNCEFCKNTGKILLLYSWVECECVNKKTQIFVPENFQSDVTSCFIDNKQFFDLKIKLQPVKWETFLIDEVPINVSGHDQYKNIEIIGDSKFDGQSTLYSNDNTCERCHLTLHDQINSTNLFNGNEQEARTEYLKLFEKLDNFWNNIQIACKLECLDKLWDIAREYGYKINIYVSIIPNSKKSLWKDVPYNVYLKAVSVVMETCQKYGINTNDFFENPETEMLGKRNIDYGQLDPEVVNIVLKKLIEEKLIEKNVLDKIIDEVREEYENELLDCFSRERK